MTGFLGQGRRMRHDQSLQKGLHLSAFEDSLVIGRGAKDRMGPSQSPERARPPPNGSRSKSSTAGPFGLKGGLVTWDPLSRRDEAGACRDDERRDGMFRSVIEHAYRHPPSVEVGGFSSGLGTAERFAPLRSGGVFAPNKFVRSRIHLPV